MTVGHSWARLRILIAVALMAAALIALCSVPASAQSAWLSPTVGWTEIRGFTVGARIGHEVRAGFDVAAQGLLAFPDESGVVGPGSTAKRSSWRTSANLIYTFDRTRALSPFVGVGARYGRATLTVVSRGYRSADARGGFGHDLFGGVRLPRLPYTPWVEYRRSGDLTIWTGGIEWRF